VVDAGGSFGAETKYERLHHLLDQTSLFAKFLSERMPSRYAAASKQAAVSSTGPKASQLAERAAALKQLIPDASLELQPFQVQGIDWLISLYENGLNGILADEMVLGKTIQVVMFLAHLRRHKVFGPFLIVAPLGTLPAWKNELARWTPEVPLLLYHGTKQERATMVRTMRAQFAGASSPDATFPVVITNYETAMRMMPHISNLRLCPPTTIVPHQTLATVFHVPANPASTDAASAAGYTIPKGSLVVPSIWSSNRQGFSNPDSFDPDRFSPERAEDKKYADNFLTFGVGPHMCMGQRYAMNHLVTFIALLAYETDFTRLSTPTEEQIKYLPTIYPVDDCPLQHFAKRNWLTAQ
jgi:hypothetical protein